MTAGNNGANTPEDDDPFGYLYEDGQAAGATAPSGRGRGYGYPGPAPQPGVPRTSYNHVRAVGDRQVSHTQGHGQQFPQQQGHPQQGYGHPTAQYAAPETYPGGVTPRSAQQQPTGGRGSGRGPNTKGLLIGALVVLAVVVAGIAAALISPDDKDDKAGGEVKPSTAPSQTESTRSSEPESKEEKPAGLPKQDAATLKLGAPAQLDTVIKGAKGADGAYVKFNGVGGSASWSVDVPADGPYTMFITYGVPGKDAETSLTINGGTPRKINMSNFAKAAAGDWEKGWTRTFVWIQLKQGKNDLKISCEQGNQCEAVLDQVRLEAGEKRSSS
ncbi:carbohydrate-binding protein [Streptomyces albipurpureus]|uniref:Carbohydrate-binding protein n=1 Tax=Streptomyces albipurpureus TaxID=2897419 RepID=A0ABT0V1I8_9ACTN|nr:carbohydrate-binding protein [Streptomyces sp. CWNU-1]MCM2394205.1 carbohydrate-binding protein [Streptomyces sp. CWNU-1]